MLILEGTDLTGKTTFAKQLLKLPFFESEGYVYQHLSKLPYGFDHCWHYKALASRRAIWDRFHMSEIVYAAVRHEDTKLYPERYRWVDGCLRLLGALTVIITADESLLRGRMREGEMYTLDQILEVNRRFTEILYRRLELKNEGKSCRYKDVDWDYRIHCTLEVPFPTSAHLHEIAKHYQHRQDLLP